MFLRTSISWVIKGRSKYEHKKGVGERKGGRMGGRVEGDQFNKSQSTVLESPKRGPQNLALLGRE